MNALFSLFSSFTWGPWVHFFKVLKGKHPLRTHVEHYTFMVSLFIIVFQAMVLVVVFGIWAVWESLPS